MSPPTGEQVRFNEDELRLIHQALLKLYQQSPRPGDSDSFRPNVDVYRTLKKVAAALGHLSRQPGMRTQ